MVESHEEALPRAGALKKFYCDRCHTTKINVIKVEDKLICLQCRFKEIGRAAIFEPLYNGLEQI